jgi:replicative DNA helicase
LSSGIVSIIPLIDFIGQGEIIIAKHRNGSLKNVRLKFTAEFAKFSDLDYFDGSDFDDTESDNSSMVSMSSSMNKDNDGDDPF